jgi:hypothetical protein
MSTGKRRRGVKKRFLIGGLIAPLKYIVGRSRRGFAEPIPRRSAAPDTECQLLLR